MSLHNGLPQKVIDKLLVCHHSQARESKTNMKADGTWELCRLRSRPLVFTIGGSSGSADYTQVYAASEDEDSPFATLKTWAQGESQSMTVLPGIPQGRNCKDDAKRERKRTPDSWQLWHKFRALRLNHGL